jgi:agmatinase
MRVTGAMLLVRTRCPLHKAVDGNRGWRWYNPENGMTAPDTPAVAAIFAFFEQPNRKEDFSLAEGDPKSLSATIEALHRAGFLVTDGADAAGPETPKACGWNWAAADQTFANAPPPALSRAIADVAFGGFPYGLGSPAPAVAQGPDMIRRLARSFVYQVDGHTGVPVGFVNMRTGGVALSGVSFVDYGNVQLDSQRLDTSGDGAAMAAAAAALWRQHAVLVAFGGNHAITAPILSGLSEPVQVIQFDAHLDLEAGRPQRLDHAAAASDIARLDHVVRLVQVGVRGFDDIRFARSLADQRAKLTRIDGPDLQSALRNAIDPNLPVYITFDVDCLEPMFAPGTYHLSPGGLSVREATQLVRGVAERAALRGLDIVEVNPDLDTRGLTLHAAILILLETLDAWSTCRSGQVRGR